MEYVKAFGNKAKIAHAFMLLTGFSPCFAQDGVNPGRPSYSENTFIVPKRAFQSENGFQYAKFDGIYDYNINSVLRFGIRPRWEARLFSSIESLSNKRRKSIPVSIPGVGVGLKYFAMREQIRRPSLAFIAQPYYLRVHRIATSFGVLASKSIKAFSFDLNVSAKFDRFTVSKLDYIFCANYLRGRVGYFLEFVLAQDRPGRFLNHQVQVGCSWMFSKNYQFDIALSSFNRGFTHHGMQTGFSFLLPRRKRRAGE